MTELLGLEVADIQRAIDEPGYRSLQLFEWIYCRSVFDFAAMTNLPSELRQRLKEEFTITLPEILGVQTSADGTTKYALTAGGETIEAVHMPEEKRDTICISSQAGCSFGCKFCVTARMNLRRHLTAGEIVGEVLLLLKHHGRDQRLNIVFMGMGEPFHNYDNVMKAFRIMTHPRGLAISSRRITVSTVGFIPSLLRLKEEATIPNIAVSLNAPNNELRSELMPINRMYPIEVLIKTLNELPLKHRQRITFEYVLLKGVNDSPKHAQQLIQVTREIRCKINLIPLNPDPHLPYERPSDVAVSAFAGILVKAGRTVAVRRSRGPDISAACGQLGTQYIEPSRIPLGLTTKAQRHEEGTKI
jgi:23S rRNA (adenine2503-C2)-methyltransferase